MKAYKIIHPAHVAAWVDIHAHPDSGRKWRYADARDAAPAVPDADRDCVVIVVEEAEV